MTTQEERELIYKYFPYNPTARVMIMRQIYNQRNGRTLFKSTFMALRQLGLMRSIEPQPLALLLREMFPVETHLHCLSTLDKMQKG